MRNIKLKLTRLKPKDVKIKTKVGAFVNDAEIYL